MTCSKCKWMGCAALVIQLLWLPYRTVTPGSCGCGIRGEARRRNERTAGCVYNAVWPGARWKHILGTVRRVVRAYAKEML